MGKIFWLINRLKAMSFSEIIYRIKRKESQYINKIKYRKITNVTDVTDVIKLEYDSNILYKNLTNIFNELNISKIKEVTKFNIFNDYIDLSKNISWHKGINGIWNKEISCYDIEFKSTDNIGDIRHTWEINRHQFIPYLAGIYLKTNDNKILDLLEKHLDDWFENNNFLKGVNWCSSMEIALRAYQWLILLFLLKDSDLKQLNDKLCRAIIVSIDYVMKNLSLYSSANNHLIIEVAISSIIGYCFEGIYRQSWFKRGYRILKGELRKQFHEDGINKEQALHYQAFVTDMMLQYNTILKKIGYVPIEEELIGKSVEFIESLNCNNIYMDFGDSDDARILSFRNDKYNYYDYILSFATAYYNKEYSNNYDLYPEISLFYDNRIDLKTIDKKEFMIYKDGGYSIINHNGNNILFDFGELGFGSLAAHGHADALMVIYYKNNNGFFIDSGTYIYNIEKSKRNYYRSTEAHSTLCYFGKNQSEIKGPFLWGKKSKSELIRYEDGDDSFIIEATNDGYNPNLHKRRLEYKKNDGSISIYDFFDNEAEINYILDNNVKVEKINDKILKLTNNSCIYVYIDGKIEIKNINISKQFLKETISKKINIKYSFKKEHLTLIADDINKLKLLMVEKGR